MKEPNLEVEIPEWVKILQKILKDSKKEKEEEGKKT